MVAGMLQSFLGSFLVVLLMMTFLFRSALWGLLSMVPLMLTIGLIYGLTITPQGRVDIQMTLTSPACPVAGSLPCQVEQAVRNVAGVSDAGVELVWDPPWTQERMSEAAQLELGIY